MTKIRHRNWANQLHKALIDRGQTWQRDASTKQLWAEDFESLETEVGRKRLERTLDWYCRDGCGAIFVPLVGNAETFRNKFEQVDAARKRLRGQPLTYFDDVLKYRIRERQTGSEVQKQHARVMQRLQQQVAFIDDLANGRKKLPKPKATLKLHTGSKRKYSPYLTKARRTMTAEQKQQLDQLLEIDRDLIWRLLMQNPVNHAEFHERLENSGFWRPFKILEKRAAMELEQIEKDPVMDDVRRRHLLKPEPGRNPRKRQSEYKAGKRAYWLGQSLQENPYRNGSLSSELWLDGWKAAQHCDQINPKVAAEIKKARRA